MTTTDRVAAALAAFVDPRGRADIRFGLDRIKQALSKLGDPQDKIPPAIHIAGTNGKGSAAAFCRAIADETGLCAHVFTSPHLIRVNERIRVAGRLVDDDALAEALADIEATGEDLTYFEALTAAAYLLFSQTPADVSIIETGAGGLLDSTNVMQKPAATLITAVSRDHEKLFGTSDVVEIAQTKAGIFRTGVPAVIAPQDEAPFDALIKAAGRAGAVLKAHGAAWTVELGDGNFIFNCGDRSISTPSLGLAGAHQAGNAGAAAAAMLEVFPDLRDADLRAGLMSAHWPARMQVLQDGPLTALAGDADIVVDGAHNPAGARALAAALAGGPRPTLLIVALQANKDIGRVAGPLAQAVELVVACPLPDAEQEGGRGAPPDQIAGVFSSLGVHALAADDVSDAVRLSRAANAKRIVVCGSLYLAGAALEANLQAVD